MAATGMFGTATFTGYGPRLLLVSFGCALLAGGALAAPQSADEKAKILAALPAAAPAKPAKPRKLLVFSLTKGFQHSAIPCGAFALAEMGKKTGAYDAVLSTDPSVFAPESIKQFDAVCFNNTTGELFEDAGWKKNLLDWVRSGKGVVGIHAATDTFYQWPEYGELIGGYFDGHPWNEKVAIKLEEPGQPLNAAFKGQPFEIADEIYQFKAPYGRDKLRVLLSLDTSKTDMTKNGINRTDGDFAVSWVRSFGAGRVFYCSLGHREEIFWNPAVLQHMLAGIQFALGDLLAETAPSGKAPAGDTAKGGDWTPLFSGKDLAGWQCKPGSWAAENGVLVRKGGGDIWTAEQFGDYALDLEFRIAPGGNSGVFIRTADINDPVQTGIEIQVLDSYGKPQVDKHDCGAVYDCVAPSKNAAKPAGEWNRMVITCDGRRIGVVLNGEPIIDMDLDRWTEAGKNPDGTPNKFRTAYKDMPRRGYIGFQDYGNELAYRNIRLKRLGK